MQFQNDHENLIATARQAYTTRQSSTNEEIFWLAHLAARMADAMEKTSEARLPAHARNHERDIPAAPAMA